MNTAISSAGRNVITAFKLNAAIITADALTDVIAIIRAKADTRVKTTSIFCDLLVIGLDIFIGLSIALVNRCNSITDIAFASTTNVISSKISISIIGGIATDNPSDTATKII